MALISLPLCIYIYVYRLLLRIDYDRHGSFRHSVLSTHKIIIIIIIIITIIIIIIIIIIQSYYSLDYLCETWVLN